jgi:hypothetical protein
MPLYLYNGEDLKGKKVALIDFGKKYKEKKSEFEFYRDLSVDGDVKEAMKNLYS